jgi:hypothetical protein
VDISLITQDILTMRTNRGIKMVLNLARVSYRNFGRGDRVQSYRLLKTCLSRKESCTSHSCCGRIV